MEHLQTTNGNNELKVKQDALDIQAADIERKQSKLVAMFKAETLSDTDLETLSASLKLDRERLNKERQELSKQAADQLSLSSTIGDWNAAMWQGLPPVTERRLFQAAVRKITVYPYHVRICLNNRKCFLLTRYLKGNARLLPPVAFFWQGEVGTIPQVVYIYHTEHTRTATLYEDATIKVLSNGVPKLPSRSAVMEDGDLFKRLYNLPTANTVVS